MKSWLEIYRQSFLQIPPLLPEVRGITVGFNTNVDAIAYFSGENISKLLHSSKVDLATLETAIARWEGTISSKTDFLAGLIGCFKIGKASEWIVQDEATYREILDFIPGQLFYSMGGQAGIMAEVLSNIGIREVIVHIAACTKNQCELFSDSLAIKVPIKTKNGSFALVHPVNAIDPKLEATSSYFHIIAEFQKGDLLQLVSGEEYLCPRSNRFISTYDPPNSLLEIMPGFQENIELIAKTSDAFILSGFHVLAVDLLGRKGIQERFTLLENLLTRAKHTNPDLLIQLELCSTKNKLILQKLVSFIGKNSLFDSLSLNEREVIELLTVLGHKNLADKLKTEIKQEALLVGCLEICKTLEISRLHLHQYGSYVLVVHKSYLLNNRLAVNDLQVALCFASAITANRAKTGEVSLAFDLEELIRTSQLRTVLPKTFVELGVFLSKGESEAGASSEQANPANGFAIIDDYAIIAIPTLLIPKPLFTVGLGDTISSATLAAELALRIKKS